MQTSTFLDATASPSTYPYQWVGQWLRVSDLEIAIASPSFASLFFVGFVSVVQRTLKWLRNSPQSESSILYTVTHTLVQLLESVFVTQTVLWLSISTLFQNFRLPHYYYVLKFFTALRCDLSWWGWVAVDCPYQLIFIKKWGSVVAVDCPCQLIFMLFYLYLPVVFHDVTNTKVRNMRKKAGKCVT